LTRDLYFIYKQKTNQNEMSNYFKELFSRVASPAAKKTDQYGTRVERIRAKREQDLALERQALARTIEQEKGKEAFPPSESTIVKWIEPENRKLLIDAGFLVRPKIKDSWLCSNGKFTNEVSFLGYEICWGAME